ncbi:MAG: hypothetical protein HC831_31195 [Chloroflexia bacterium]|nr:hypothetical protein [Chloroflexia bacterium]
MEETVRKINGSIFYNLYIRTCQSLSEIYSSLKNYKKAFYYQSESFRVRDSVYTLEKFNRAYELEIAYDKAVKEKEAIELKKANEIDKLMIRNTRNIAILVGIGLLLLSVFLYVIYKRNKIAKEMAIMLKNQQALLHEQEKKNHPK